jgi:hypothetical protein
MPQVNVQGQATDHIQSFIKIGIENQCNRRFTMFLRLSWAHSTKNSVLCDFKWVVCNIHPCAVRA